VKQFLLPSRTIVQFVIGAVLLVIVGVIVYGNLSRQKEASLRTSEARNLQQWGIALNLYLIENENQLPEVGATPVTEEQKKAWYNVLPPYVSETSLAAIPPGQRPRPGEPSFWVRPTTKPVKIWDPQTFYFSYGMNRYLQPVETARSFRIHEIAYPGNVVFLVPVSGYTPAAVPETVVFSSDKEPEVPVLFCDGHVQTVKKSVLLAPGAHEAAAAAGGPSWFEK
jgi:hypothetical protein